jgi:hypothetical protein
MAIGHVGERRGSLVREPNSSRNSGPDLSPGAGEFGTRHSRHADPRLLRAYSVMAHLRSCGKGANKTPPDCVASDLPQVGRDGPSAIRWTFLGAVRGAEGETGKTEEGVTGGHNLRSAAFAARCLNPLGRMRLRAPFGAASLFGPHGYRRQPEA